MLSVYAIEKSEIYGHGKRVVIWFSGCSLRCKGCINSHLWNKNSGREFTAEILFEEIYSLGDFDGVTYIGGEPLEQGHDLIVLSKKLINANKDIVLFTGYELEELAEEKLEVCNLSSVVICGRYIEKERDKKLRGRKKRWLILSILFALIALRVLFDHHYLCFDLSFLFAVHILIKLLIL